MTEVVYDALQGAVYIPSLGIKCEAGVPVDVPANVAAELLAGDHFKKPAAKRPTTKEKE